jgi:hypothetical protein
MASGEGELDNRLLGGHKTGVLAFLSTSCSPLNRNLVQSLNVQWKLHIHLDKFDKCLDEICILLENVRFRQDKAA